MRSARIRPEQLDAEAQITPEDIEHAKAAARRYCTPLMLAMLNAKAEPRVSRGREG